MEKKSSSNNSSAVFKIGSVSLVFLIILYQVALFVHKAATLRLLSHIDRPDTVFVVQYLQSDTFSPSEGGFSLKSGDSRSGSENFGNRGGAGSPSEGSSNSPRSGKSNALSSSLRAIEHSETLRVASPHSPAAFKAQRKLRKVETFRFDPNTASIDELQRLGFSEKQAAAIDNYRRKGGRFRRKSDFGRSFVVSDSIYRRLESYIHIPKLDINSADSAAFDALPGIGPYYAAQMVKMRKRLCGYSYKEQLMDIWQFDSSRFAALSDLICCDKAAPYPLWRLSADSLRLHPYIGSYQTAKEIVLFREHTPSSGWSVEALRKAGILSKENAEKLERCNIAPVL